MIVGEVIKLNNGNSILLTRQFDMFAIRFDKPLKQSMFCQLVRTGILTFRPPGLGSYFMRATASYSSEGLVATPLN